MKPVRPLAARPKKLSTYQIGDLWFAVTVIEARGIRVEAILGRGATEKAALAAVQPGWRTRCSITTAPRSRP